MYRKLLSSVFVVVLVITSSFGLNVMAENNSEYTEKISSELAEVIDAKQASDSVSVCIWYDDIDHQLVETEIVNNIGISKADINTQLEMPSNEILDYYQRLGNDCALDDMSLTGYDMQEYLNDTQESRAIEKMLVDKYVNEKKEVSAKYIQQEYNNLMEDTCIEENKILFKSKYSPMIIVECKVKDVSKFAESDRIESISYFEPYEGEVYPPSLEGYQMRNGFWKLNKATGLTGNDVEIGIIDHGYPELCVDIDSSQVEFVGGDSVTGDHATGTMELFIGIKGFTENLKKLYCASLNDESCPGGTSFYYGIERLIDKGVNIISGSVDIGGRYIRNEETGTYDEIDIYTTQEKWLDYMTYHYDVLYFQAAGNGAQKDDKLPDKILNLGLSYNALTVGAMGDSYNIDVRDDIVSVGSAYENYTEVDGEIIYGCHKPDLICSESIENHPTGTSITTPIVAAMAVYMIELKPSLEVHPQIIKAILTASCHRKALDPDTGVQEEFMEEGLTFRQGAGVVDVYRALCIVGNGQYGERTIESYRESDSFRIIQPKYYNSNLNISIAWFNQNIDLLNNVYPNPMVSSGGIDNLDMAVYDLTTAQYIGGSALDNSSTEMSYVPLTSNINDFNIIIEKDLPSYQDVTYGYAWSTDEMEYVDSGEEGIFFINNKRSRHYLCADENNSLIQNDHGNIQWVIRKEGDYYTIRNGTKTGGIGKGNNINTNIYEGTLTEDNLNITIDLNDNGTFSFKSIVNNKDSYLQAVDGSYLLGAKMCWNEQVSNDSSEWYFEKINYKKGDVDMNGVIDTDDVMLFVEAFNTDLDLTENQEYLADVNNDGDANSADIGVLNELIE